MFPNNNHVWSRTGGGEHPERHSNRLVLWSRTGGWENSPKKPGGWFGGENSDHPPATHTKEPSTARAPKPVGGLEVWFFLGENPERRKEAGKARSPTQQPAEGALQE